MSKLFEKALAKAKQAGMAAGTAVNPEPMHLTDGRQTFTVPDGPCGFAWVVVRPGTSSFARWMKKNHGARPHYYGGMMVDWVGEFGQSMTRKAAYADAFAASLRETLGVNATANSRMD